MKLRILINKIILILIVIITIFIIYGLKNTKLKLTSYEYTSAKVPKDFDGYKILQISDLHHKNFGTNQKKLIRLIQKQEPDLILLTGDIIDEEHTDMSSVRDLLEGICDLAPVYYITGNHELLSEAKNQYAELLALFVQYGVTDLDDSSVEIKKGNSSIFLYGQKFRSYYVKDYLKLADTSKFNILMYHCSDYFDITSQYGYDLIFSGHTHGGIVRLPFLGGVFGNDKELFPKYAGGIHQQEGSTLISSCGLGDAKIRRFNNPPEVVLVTLHSS